MKLRIHENRVRLRLSQAEVQMLGAGGSLESTTPFVPEPLIFRLATFLGAGKAVVAFSSGKLDVQISQSQARDWANTDEVAIEQDVPGGGGTTVELLIEKDFQCLHGETDGQEDCFPNPRASEISAAETR